MVHGKLIEKGGGENRLGNCVSLVVEGEDTSQLGQERSPKDVAYSCFRETKSPVKMVEKSNIK